MKKKQQSVGQGHGTAGVYAGLPEEFSSSKSSKIVIIPVPFDKTTTYQKGSDKGPAALIEASRNMELYDIETDSEIYLRGIHTDSPIKEKTSKAMLDAAYKQTKKWLDQDKFVAVIGGEHAISYAPIKAHADHYGTLTVLQIDAHADLQDAYEGNPLSHASVMARVKELPNVDKIVSVGIRSMSSEELPNLDRPNTFFAHELDDQGKWMEKVLKKIKGPVYVTFDLDGFSSALMPSTGTPEPGGLSWNQATRLLKLVAEKKQIVGFDVVELCPQPGSPASDYLAAKLVYKLLSYIFCEGK